MHALPGTALLVCTAFLGLGCAGIARNAAREVTPGVIEGAIDAGVDPKNQKRIVEGIDPAIVQSATEKLIAGVVDGTLNSLNDPKRKQQLREGIGGATKDLGAAMGDAVQASAERVMTPENGEKLRAGVRVLVKDAVAASFEQGREELAKVDTKAIDAAMSSTARELSKQAALGFQDAVDETARRKRDHELGEDEGNLLNAANRATKGGSMLPLVVAGIAGFAVALLAAILWVGRRRRGERSSVAARDEALVAMVDLMKAADSKPWSSELRGLLKDTLHERENVDHLRSLLKRREAERSSLAGGGGSTSGKVAGAEREHH